MRSANLNTTGLVPEYKQRLLTEDVTPDLLSEFDGEVTAELERTAVGESEDPTPKSREEMELDQKELKFQALAEAAALKAMWERAKLEIVRERDTFKARMFAAANRQSEMRRVARFREELRELETGPSDPPLAAAADWKIKLLAGGAVAAAILATAIIVVAMRPALPVQPGNIPSRLSTEKMTGERETPARSGTEFSIALERLDNAMNSVGSPDPEGIVRSATRPDRTGRKGCSLVWNDSGAALVFGAKPLQNAVSDCAETLESMAKNRGAISMPPRGESSPSGKDKSHADGPPQSSDAP